MEPDTGGVGVSDGEAEPRDFARRQFLKLGMAVAAGVGFLGMATRPVEAAPKFIEMGVLNTANALTRLRAASGNVFLAIATNGRAVQGDSTSDFGVVGRSTEKTGVYGEGGIHGVEGFSGPNIGVRARSASGTGVAGTSGTPPPSPPGPPGVTPPIGVLGESFNAQGVGVVGKGPNTGVAGFSETGVAVKADAIAGPAVVGSSQGAQGLVGSTSALNVAAVEGVATNTDLSTFNTGVFGRVERGHGVQGFAANGIGVKGQSEDPSGSGIGVLGDAAAGVAVKGFSRDATGIGIGVLGEAVSGVGLKGYVGAPGGFGVIGEAPQGSGVFGTSATGNGLHGYSGSGLALYAQGREWFDSLVLVPITVGESSGTVTGVTHATAGSFAIATIQGASVGAPISHVQIPAAGTVTVHLSAPATSSGYAAVLVVN